MSDGHIPELGNDLKILNTSDLSETHTICDACSVHLSICSAISHECVQLVC